MKDDHLFIGLIIVLGAAIGTLLAFFPQSRSFALPPYFWVVIAMGLIEVGLALRRGGTFQPTVTMQARIIGLTVAIALMLLIPYLAGVTGSIL
jgi:hypothetical protein